MKHALQCIKYSGAKPQLALLALHATPIDANLLSPAELLYQCQIRTTKLGLTQLPSRFVNELMPTLMPPSHRQTNDANLLHPCMLASQL